jgi:hypothetical protein
MNDEHMDDLLRELRDDLTAVRPSPEFAARVRRQVETQPARRWFGIWQVATAASGVALAAVALMAWRAQAPAGEPQAPITVTAQNPNPPTPSPAAASSVSTAQPTAVAVNRVTPRQVTAAPPVHVQQVAAREPEVLIPAGDVLAFSRLMSRVRSGALIELASKGPLIDEVTGELASVPALTIPPLVVEPLPGTVDGRSGGSDKR